MGLLKREKKKSTEEKETSSVQTGSLNNHPFYQLNGYTPLCGTNYRVYAALREGIPIIDSAVNKIVRLMGGFKFVTGNKSVDDETNKFFERVNVGGNQRGLQSFLDNFVSQLLTYGTAIGEIVGDENGIYALYNGSLESIDVKRKTDSLDLEYYNTSSGKPIKVQDESKILFSVLNPEPGEILGTSLLRGLPFVSDILLKIYNTIGTNWQRVGNLRYAVTYKSQNDGGDKSFAKERATQMANAWRDAMSSSEAVKDFVAVGDVKVSVIGADNQILDSEVPVRQMLEQIIAKTGLMPYMFGLSWSTTEKMSQQQADILTTELKAYRRIVTPVLRKIGEEYLFTRGCYTPIEVEWEDITLQDETEHAQARLYNAQAEKIIGEVNNEP